MSQATKYDVIVIGTSQGGRFSGSDFQKEAIAQTPPLGRIGRPNDIAPVAVFLASAESGWITGEIIHVSGGLR